MRLYPNRSNVYLMPRLFLPDQMHLIGRFDGKLYSIPELVLLILKLLPKLHGVRLGFYQNVANTRDKTSVLYHLYTSKGEYHFYCTRPQQPSFVHLFQPQFQLLQKQNYNLKV